MPASLTVRPVHSGLAELDRYELIDGELVRKLPKDHPHILALALLCDWLRTVFGEDQVVQEPTIDVSAADHPTSAPEPDAVVLRCALRTLSGRAKPEQIYMIVEVSDSTLFYDLTTKAELYARAGIADYWVLDLNGRRMLVHRKPQDGVYQSVVAFAEHEPVTPLASPNAELRAADLL